MGKYYIERKNERDIFDEWFFRGLAYRHEQKKQRESIGYTVREGERQR